MAGIRGLKTERRAWADPFRRQFPKVAPKALTEAERVDQAERTNAVIARFVGHCQTPQQRAEQIIADHDARTAVEGDTDLNHDNVEGAE